MRKVNAMGSVFKLSLSLLGNQILASVAGGMSVFFVYFIAGDSIWSQIIFLAITMSFFIYIEYRAAYNYGFHNPDRRNAPESKSYLYKGALAGLISFIPLLILIVLFIIFQFNGNVLLAQTFKLYARMFAMYYNWPMCNIFPNHDIAVLISSIIPAVVLPAFGYIAGYKNIMISDKIITTIKKYTKV